MDLVKVDSEGIGWFVLGYMEDFFSCLLRNLSS
jgi:hypothetical protein